MRILVQFLMILCPLSLLAQEDFCLSLTDFIKIENEADVPIITDMGDGTITLTHPNQDITNMFAAYTIFNLEQSFPSSSNEELLKFYDLEHSSRSLINDIQFNIPETIYSIEENYTSEFPFVDDFISFIDGKQFIYSGFGQNSDEGGGNCDDIFTCELDNVTDSTSLSVLFEYDTVSETLFLETTSPSICGNGFKLGFKPGFQLNDGGSSVGSIQEWSVENVVTAQADTSDECYLPETFLYDLFGFGCESQQFFGNITMFYSPDIEKIRFFRENAIFFTGIVEFRDPNLGIEENSFNDTLIFQSRGAEELQVVNNIDLVLYAVIYDTTGKIVLNNGLIKNEKINIPQLSKNQLYVIELKTEANQRKLVKFIKR